jgi:hypothetical protein
MKKRGLGWKLLELSMISLSGSQRNFRYRTALSLRISASGTPGGIMSEQHDKELLRRAIALAEEAVAGGHSVLSYATARDKSYRKRGPLLPMIRETGLLIRKCRRFVPRRPQ